jgi:hypothetical protein
VHCCKELENNYMQYNGKADFKKHTKNSLPRILTILRNEKTKFKVALENKNTDSFY